MKKLRKNFLKNFGGFASLRATFSNSIEPLFFNKRLSRLIMISAQSFCQLNVLSPFDMWWGDEIGIVLKAIVSPGLINTFEAG